MPKIKTDLDSLLYSVKYDEDYSDLIDDSESNYTPSRVVKSKSGSVREDSEYKYNNKSKRI